MNIISFLFLSFVLFLFLKFKGEYWVGGEKAHIPDCSEDAFTSPKLVISWL